MTEHLPCGWSGSIQTFLTLTRSEWLSSLQTHHLRCMNSPADQSQILAWEHSFDILQRELKTLVQSKLAIGTYTIIFEYELPRERGRRPDVIILGMQSTYEALKAAGVRLNVLLMLEQLKRIIWDYHEYF